MPSASTAIVAPVKTAAINPPRGAWVIYEASSDPSDGFVAHKFYIGTVFTFDADEEFRTNTIEEARALLPAGLVNVGRQDGDTPDVVETWC